MNLLHNFIWVIIAVVFAIVFADQRAAVVADSDSNDVPFQQNYQFLYGQYHSKVFTENNTVDLTIDTGSGSGFGSLRKYASGSFAMRIKLAPKNTSCIITTFYLTSAYEPHDEIDFEFLGGESYELQTNVYSNGLGGREQKVALWFDPTTDFHTYQILWNSHQIVFLVDTVPIRVFKNNSAIGVPYPWRPMQVEATIWEGDWACGLKKANLSQGPFVASYQGFGITGCPMDNNDDRKARERCYSPKLWWNLPKRWELNRRQKQSYKNVMAHHITYDYCQDRPRYPVTPPECKTNLSL